MMVPSYFWNVTERNDNAFSTSSQEEAVEDVLQYFNRGASTGFCLLCRGYGKLPSGGDVY